MRGTPSRSVTPGLAGSVKLFALSFVIGEVSMPYAGTYKLIACLSSEYPRMNPCSYDSLRIGHASSCREFPVRRRTSYPILLKCYSSALNACFVSRLYVTKHRSSASSMNFPSLYFSEFSYALSYFQPTILLHCRQLISRTMCLPVVMLRSPASPFAMLTTESKRYALPCWPRKFW